MLAPVRVWGFSGQYSIEYAARHNIPITVTEAKPAILSNTLRVQAKKKTKKKKKKKTALPIASASDQPRCLCCSISPLTGIGPFAELIRRANHTDRSAPQLSPTAPSAA